MSEAAKVNAKKNAGSYAPHGRNEAKRRRLELNPGCKGVLLTSTSAGKTKESIREFMTILKRYLAEKEENSKDVLNGSKAGGEKEEEKEGKVDELEKEIKAEISELQEEQKRFVPVKDICKGVSFVRFCREEDVPSEIVHDILLVTLNTNKYFCRFLSRLIPVDCSCKPYADDFEKCVVPLLKKHFVLKKEEGGEKEKEKETEENKEQPSLASWCCIYTSRSMGSLKKENALDILTKYIDNKHKVNLTQPELSVIVEVNPLICGVSVVKDFSKLLKHNIHRMCNKEDEEGKEKEENSKDKTEKVEEEGKEKEEEEEEEKEEKEKEEKTNGTIEKQEEKQKEEKEVNLADKSESKVPQHTSSSH